MEPPATSDGVVRRRGAAVSWVLLVVLGLVLGAAAWFPLVFLWMLGQAVVGALGWTPVDVTLIDDGWIVLVGSTAVLWFVFVAVAVPLTWAVGRTSRLASRTWWLGSVLLWMAPFGLVMLRAQLQ